MDDPTGGDPTRLAMLAMGVFEMVSRPMTPPPDRCPACAGETRLEGIGYRVRMADCANQFHPKRW